MRRGLQGLDQQLPGSCALQAEKLVCVDHDDGIAAMQRDMLRPVTVSQAHEFAEARLGVLKAPTTAGRLRGRMCQDRCFSGHAD